ncbi:MAG: hypothetical protein D6693_00700 [Planctomycetota bacterium]|nr:MAG: hypothetical protein D6693_00700 [Planctomycetota bacterium]
MPPEALLLAAIEDEPLAPDDRRVLDEALQREPGLASFLAGARRDRDLVRALARLDEGRAPPGLARAALAHAERAAIVGAGLPDAGPRRLRITPVRFVAAAAVLLLAGSASIVGLIFSGPTTNRPPGLAPTGPAGPGLAQAPTEATAPPGEPGDALALADAPGRAEAARQRSASVASAPAETAQGGSLADAEESADPAGAGLAYRMIRSVKAGPDRAVSPERAAALALKGRLMIVAQTTVPPAQVEAALLEPADAARTEALVRWRPIAELAPGADPLPADGPRLVLADAVASPAVLEGVLGRLRSLGGAGAWLQELDRPIRLTPRADESDARWWLRPGEAWAPRATTPVLIEPAPAEAPR